MWGPAKEKHQAPTQQLMSRVSIIMQSNYKELYHKTREKRQKMVAEIWVEVLAKSASVKLSLSRTFTYLLNEWLHRINKTNNNSSN